MFIGVSGVSGIDWECYKMNQLLKNVNGFTTKIVKFLSVGLLNTVFGYAIYAAFLFINLPYLTALCMATIVGVVFNYFSFGRIVFKEHGGWLVFGKFIVAYAMVYVINAILLSILTQEFNFNPYIGQVICIPPTVLISWLLMNYWVYKYG
jgi:putative flippase GtrA